ncbi:PP2C family protein-serine/threonine phosphatase [Streptomyces sp. NPDC058623]|uniref:PP2C family protein-serine/threonine phosphatase n=1 Tax=Streptomyces sp. NPDC058623 TaxID=3346563 RepID=UPI003654D463
MAEVTVKRTDQTAFPGTVRSVRADGLPSALSHPRRLKAVAATGLLDTGPEEAFDDLAQMAATLTRSARAFITLVDDRRSFWKSCVGVDATTIEERQKPVRESFCYFLVDLVGEPFIVEDAATDPRTRDHPSVAAMRIGAWAGYPILGPAGEVLGSMCVIDERPRRWEPAELVSLSTMARAVGNEINLRTSLDEAQAALTATRDLARSLQDSLLPPSLRPVPGLDTAAHYAPASGDASVVGDFYDLFHARGPWWTAVMGDVCGKGTDAAKITALARYTLRADAGEHLSPAEVLRRLNAAMLAQRAPRFLTAVHATFRRTEAGAAGRLCLAGHPPALIRRADGRIQQLGRAGSLLGVFPEIEISDVRFRLAPGDLLLLYTGGACEARPDPDAPGRTREMFGEEHLARTLARTTGLDAADTVAKIADVLAGHHDGWASDDTALLALRVPPRP